MFIYKNENPNGYHIPDCVIRAITGATDLPYFNVVCLLHQNASLFSCDELNVRCYEKLLDQDFSFRHLESNGKTVKEVASDFKDETLLIRIPGHLTMSKCGYIYDIWDCSDEIVTDFWIVR